MKTYAHEWKLSYYTKAMPFINGKLTFDENEIHKEWSQIKEAGIDCIGLNGINLSEKCECDFNNALLKIARMLDEFDFHITSLHFAGPTFLSLKEDQRKIQKDLEKYVETFSVWKPASLVVHASWISLHGNCPDIIKAYEKEAAENGVEKVIDTVANNLKRMARCAARHGIKLALENMGRFLPLGQLDNLPELIEKIDEPNVGYCLDSGHAHAFNEDLVEWINIMGGKLFETHFHDNRALAKNCKDKYADTKGVDEHLSPGFGTIPWIDVIQSLKNIAFKGPVTFETKGWPGEDICLGYKNAIAWWRACEALAYEKEEEIQAE